MKYFDSLVHATHDGGWLGHDRYDASLDRLLAQMDEAHVARACLVAIADFAHNEDVARFSKMHPDRFVPVGSINVGKFGDEKAVERAVEQLAGEGFRGLKLHSRLNEYNPLDVRCITAIQAAGRSGMVVFMDTLFRQKKIVTRPAADIIDHIALHCPETKIVLLHGGASAMLEVFELVRMHSNLILDLSFTILRYAGSSLDQDMRFICENLDQRVTFGSDFPEYSPKSAIARFEMLTHGIPEHKLERIRYNNLAALFSIG